MEAEHVYKNLIWQDPDRMSGQVCFYGTRIPVAFLFDYVGRGDSIERFAADYRIDLNVAREVIQLAQEGLGAFLKEAA